MDGICVRAEDTFGATEFLGKKFARATGAARGSGVFAYIDTGNALPSWANAVVMIEKVRQLDADTVEIFESVAPWNHVRLVGEISPGKNGTFSATIGNVSVPDNPIFVDNACNTGWVNVGAFFTSTENAHASVRLDHVVVRVM